MELRKKKSKAVIGLTISDRHFEQALHAQTAKKMWNMIINIFEKHTLLNNLVARRRFYTVTLKEKEKVLEFASRTRKLAGTLKSMGVTIEDSDMAIVLLNGSIDRLDRLFCALDAFGNKEKLFTFKFVNSRCQEEEQRHPIRHQGTQSKFENVAIFCYRNLCVRCGKNNSSNR